MDIKYGSAPLDVGVFFLTIPVLDGGRYSQPSGEGAGCKTRTTVLGYRYYLYGHAPQTEHLGRHLQGCEHFPRDPTTGLRSLTQVSRHSIG